MRRVLETQQKGRVPVCVWSDGDGIQPFLGLGSWRCPQELRCGGVAEVLDREDKGDRHCGERETRPSLGLILEKTPEVLSVPRSSKRVELKMGNGNGMLTTNLGVVWKLLRPSWCPHPHASLIEEVTERVRLAPTEDEDLATLSIVHRLILPHVKESGEVTSGTGSVKKMEPGSCLDSTCGNGEHTCDGRSCSGYSLSRRKT